MEPSFIEVVDIPAVNIAGGPGVALRVGNLVAWFDPGPGIDITALVRDLVGAAHQSAGQLPLSFLGDLASRMPDLALSVVAFGPERVQIWVRGATGVTIDGAHGPVAVDGLGAEPVIQDFDRPLAAVRLGENPGTVPWSQLVEGAVPASGVAIIWQPEMIGADPEHSGAEPQSAAGPEPEEVLVSGLMCSRGHFNHPMSANCGWCGIAMLQASRVLVTRPRPPLGVLVIDGQMTVTLDADYVIGRQPRHLPDVDGVGVREIVLDGDRSISRAHAAVRLHDWEVLALDLGSDRGTWLQQAGQQFQLPPNQPVPLVSGAVLFVGNHRLTYYPHHVR